MYFKYNGKILDVTAKDAGLSYEKGVCHATRVGGLMNDERMLEGQTPLME